MPITFTSIAHPDTKRLLKFQIGLNFCSTLSWKNILIVNGTELALRSNAKAKLSSIFGRYRLGSRFCVNETSQFSERNSAQIQAAMKQKR